MRLSLPQKKDAFAVLIGISVGVLNDDKAHEFEHLRYDQVMQIASCYANVVPRIVEIDHEASCLAQPINRINRSTNSRGGRPRL
jgi:hypothetical protein